MLSLALYLCRLQLNLFLTTKRYPSDDELSYVMIFNLFLEPVQPVGVTEVLHA